MQGDEGGNHQKHADRQQGYAGKDHENFPAWQRVLPVEQRAAGSPAEGEAEDQRDQAEQSEQAGPHSGAPATALDLMTSAEAAPQ